MDDSLIYERIIHEDLEKYIQLRLVINEFRGVEYLHLRKYYLDFDGNTWMPSSEGVSMPLDLNNVQQLFQGLVEILSLAESKEILEHHFKDTLDYLYLK